MADDPLEILQNPQEPASQPAANMAVINQFNRADPQKRNVANAFGAGQFPDYDDRINRLHGIDARFLSGETAPIEQLDPEILKQAKLAQAAGQIPVAYNLLAEENKKHLARAQYGGAMTPDEWESLRDYAGKKAAARAAASEPSMPAGQPVFNRGAPGQDMLQAAMSAPDSKQALYQAGIEAFDRILGHHKKYLVELPKVPLKAPASHGGSPLRPHEDAILRLMRQVGTIAQQQQQGQTPLSVEDFGQKIGILPKVTP